MCVYLYIEKGILVGPFLFPGRTDLVVLITKCQGLPGVIYFMTCLCLYFIVSCQHNSCFLHRLSFPQSNSAALSFPVKHSEASWIFLKFDFRK